MKILNYLKYLNINRDVKEKYKIGDYFILLTNEWKDIKIVEVIGYKEGFHQGMIMPLLRDIETDSLMFGGFCIKYNEDKLKYLCELNPYERYSYSTGINIYDKIIPEGKKKETQIKNFDQWTEILTREGLYRNKSLSI